jgi:hypothetical protein
MSVDRFLLPVSDAELNSILSSPESIRELIEVRESDIVPLGVFVPAICSLTAESVDDPLDFMRSGGPDELAGWVGDIDLGYGPASYYKNLFLRVVAQKLQIITVDVFEENCDLDWLAENHVYPSIWEEDGSLEFLVDAFSAYRECVITTAIDGRHLLVWSA